MPASLPNSIDIVAKYVVIINYNNIVDIIDRVLEINNTITQIVGNPPLTLNTPEKTSQAINSDT